MSRKLSQLRSAWWRFWWGKVDPRPLAGVRIAMAIAAIAVHLTWWPDVELLLARNGMSPLVVDLPAGRGLTVFALPFAKGTGAYILHALTLLPLIGLLLGWKSRWMAFLSWLVVLGWYQRVPGASTGGDRLLRYALFYLALGNCGGAWSVDSRDQNLKPVAALPLRLIQVQWAAMYLLSGLAKSAGSRWIDGTALHYALSNLTFVRAPDLVAPLTSSTMWMPILRSFTWVVVAWELLFPLLVMHRSSRRVALLVGVAVHLGIGLTMSVGPFTAVTLLGYFAFLDGGGWQGSIPSFLRLSCNPPLDSAQARPTGRVARPIQSGDTMTRRIAKLLALTALAAVSAGCTPHTVPAGSVGVRTDWGAVQPDVYTEGLYWQPPGTAYVDMDARVQKKQANATASSKDLQVVTVIIALNYRIESTKSVEIYQNIGSLAQVSTTIIDPVLQEAVKTATARYNAEELITKRREVKEAITDYVRERLSASNLRVTDLSIVNFQFDDKYQEAIEAKQVAEQKALAATNDLRRIEVEAKQEEARALGNANSMLIQAKAEAERQELLRRTMTPELVQWQAIQKWDGRLPAVSGGTSTLIDVGSISGR